MWLSECHCVLAVPAKILQNVRKFQISKCVLCVLGDEMSASLVFDFWNLVWFEGCVRNSKDLSMSDLGWITHRDASLQTCPGCHTYLSKWGWVFQSSVKVHWFQPEPALTFKARECQGRDFRKGQQKIFYVKKFCPWLNDQVRSGQIRWPCPAKKHIQYIDATLNLFKNNRLLNF